MDTMMEILLVEDSLVQSRLAIEAIKRAHFRHRTTLTVNGQEALDFVNHRGIFHQAPRPDLILLDLRLPKIDGLDVLSEIKGDDELRAIPVVIMTGSQDEQDRLVCEQLDVEAYLIKPVDVAKFLALLKDLKRFWHENMVLPTAVSQV